MDEAAPAMTCPECGEPLTHVGTEMSSGAFRTQAASMPQRPLHFYDCPGCGTYWKFGTRLLPDPVREIARATPRSPSDDAPFEDA